MPLPGEKGSQHLLCLVAQLGQRLVPVVERPQIHFANGLRAMLVGEIEE